MGEKYLVLEYEKKYPTSTYKSVYYLEHSEDEIIVSVAYMNKYNYYKIKLNYSVDKDIIINVVKDLPKYYKLITNDRKLPAMAKMVVILISKYSGIPIYKLVKEITSKDDRKYNRSAFISRAYMLKEQLLINNDDEGS